MTNLIEKFQQWVGDSTIIIKPGNHKDLLEKIGTLSVKEHPFRDNMDHIRSTSYDYYLYDIVVTLHPTKIVELGVREARSTNAFIRAFAHLKRGRLYSFDPEPHENLKHFISNHKDYWEFHRRTGEEGYNLLKNTVGRIDMLFIDTDPHSYEQTKTWLNDYWINSVGSGGYVILDDCAPQHQDGVKVIKGAFDGKANFGTLKALCEWIEENDNIIEYVFIVGARDNNGLAVVKFNEGKLFIKNKKGLHGKV